MGQKNSTNQLDLNLPPGTGTPKETHIKKAVSEKDPNPIVRAIAQNFPGAVEHIPPTQDWDKKIKR